MNKYAGSNRFAAQGIWDKKRREEGKKVTVSKPPWEQEKLHADVTVDDVVCSSEREEDSKW